MRIIKFILLLLIISSSAISQVVTKTIGNTTGTGSFFYGPIFSNTTNAGLLNYSRYSYLYTAGELNIPPGSKIVKVEWLKKDGGTIASPNKFNVWIKNSSLSSIPVSTWGSLIDGATNVYSDSTFPFNYTNNTYINCPFKDTLVYTGDGIQIMTDWGKGGIKTGNAINFYTSPAIGKSIGIASTTVMSDNITLISANYGNVRPTIRISYIIVPPCTGIPNPGNTLTTISSPCPGKPFTLSIENTIEGTGISYIWQKSINEQFTNPTSIGNGSSLTTSQNETFYYRCVVSCTSGSVGYSSVIKEQLNYFYNCYCASMAISSADEEVFRFKFSSLDNYSDCNTILTGEGSYPRSYSNYTYLTPPNIEAGSKVPYYIHIGTCLSNYVNRSAIYIDYNHNSIFDSNELVYQTTGSGFNGNHVEFGDLTISDSAMIGITGLRVIVIEGNQNPTPCGGYSFGETEDYLINIIPHTICNGSPNPGNTISSKQNTCLGTSISLSLQNITYGSGVTYQWYNSSGAISGATSYDYITYPINNIETFHCKVTCNNQTTSSNPFTIQITPFIECYGFSSAGSEADDDILSVKVNNKYYQSNCLDVTGVGSILNRYSNFMNICVDSVNTNSVVSFDIESDDCDVPPAPYYSFGTAIFVDYNQNGSFSDIGEKVFFEPSAAEGPRHVIGNFTIPSNAKTGYTGIRFVIAEGLSGNQIQPVQGYGFGETEDYKIYINNTQTSLNLNLKMFIQGYYTGIGLMNSVLMNRGVSNDPTLVDTIEVSLLDNSLLHNVVSRNKAILKTNGLLSVTMNNVTNSGPYYISVGSNNIIKTYSSSPINITNNTLYDFSNSSSKSYGNNTVNLGQGVFGIYSGDINNDDNIDLLDNSIMEKAIDDFVFGDTPYDINGDGNVDLTDSNILEENINSFIYSIQP